MSSYSGEGRMAYADICKLVAIFLVTWGHCSQALSGLAYPPILGIPGLLIPIHMPLFMIMSGFFINPSKISKASLGTFALSKIKRLIVPSFIWYLLFCLVTLSVPSLAGVGNYYWYLNSLFVCFLIIWVTVKASGNHLWIGCLISILIVLAFPYSSYLKINFMYPFLWTGYYLRKFIERKRRSFVIEIVLLIASLALYLLWNYRYSIYETPFDTMHFTIDSLLVYVYRFSIGFTCSATIILLIKLLVSKTNKVSLLALYGRDTLYVYASSFVINAIVAHCLNHLNLSISVVGILDLLSIAFALLIIICCSITSKFIRKNALAKLLLLGE